MATPELTHRATSGGIAAVWVVALVTALAIGIFVPAEWRPAWLILGLGGCMILGFVVQLAGGRSQGFTERVAASGLGALVVMGIISAGFGLAAIVPT